MCGGGSGGSTNYSDVKQTTTNLPEWAEPYYNDLLARSAYETSTPYQTYGGSRLADFSPMEQEALARYGDMGISGTSPELQQAGRMAYDVGQNSGITGLGDYGKYAAGDVGTAGDYTAGSRESGYTAGGLGSNAYYKNGSRDVGFEPGTLADKEALAQYMNPYQQMVTDINLREMSRQGDARNAATGLDAAGMGSLGGYREAIMRSEGERNMMQQMGDIQTQGSQAAYQNAQQAFEADRQAQAQKETFMQSQFSLNEQGKQRAAELRQAGYSTEEASKQAQEEMRQSQFGMNQQNQQQQAQLSLAKYNAYEQAKQEAARQGLSAAEIEQAGQIAAAQIKLDSSSMLGQYAGQQQEMEYERLKNMMNAGMMDRGMLQSSLDTGYEDFLRQQAWPKEQLAFYSSMLQGLPIKPGETTASYGNAPSTGQQMLGAGIAGLGLYNAMSNNGYPNNQGGGG